MAAQTRVIYEFDDFQLEPDERKLARRGQVVPLHGKAFELLLALIRNRGRLLTKDEIFEIVWPDQIVEESNLTVNMSAIRRALGERASNPRYITTVSGRGYRFTGEVRQFADEALTIERETFARMVVEQEEFDSEAPDAAARGQRTRNTSLRSNTLLLSVVSGVLILAVAGGSPWLFRSWSHSASVPSFGSRPLTLRRFSTHGGVPFRVVISPDGKSIVYNQLLNGKMTLWLGQIESNSSVPINQRTDIMYLALAFSPDGGNLYITMRDSQSTQTKLVRMPVVGGVMTELAENVGSGVTFSPDGQRLAFLRSNGETKQTSIVIADAADGRNERTLITRERPHNFSSEGPSWSPDGKTIVVGAAVAEVEHSELLAVSVADGTTRRVGDRDWGVMGKVAWAPDGAGVLMTARDNSITRRTQIWFVPFPTGEARRISNDLNSYMTEPLSVSRDGSVALLQGHYTSDIWVAPGGDPKRAHLALQGVEPGYEGVDGLAWTPDGRLLYSAYVGDAQSIIEMNNDGSALRQLTSNVGDAVDRLMTATADGRYMVFQSNRSGSLQIWRANADGSNLKQLTNGGSSSQPALSPDGKWIIYTSEQDSKPSLRRVSIDGGATIQLGDKRAFCPQVSPDGKSIAYVESQSSGFRLVVIPFDGGEPLKAFSLPAIVYQAKRMRWTPDGKALIYKDSALGLWRQPLDGGPRQPLKGFEDVQVSQFAWSFDGKNLAYTHGVDMREIVLLQNAK